MSQLSAQSSDTEFFWTHLNMFEHFWTMSLQFVAWWHHWPVMPMEPYGAKDWRCFCGATTAGRAETRRECTKKQKKDTRWNSVAELCQSLAYFRYFVNALLRWSMLWWMMMFQETFSYSWCYFVNYLILRWIVNWCYNGNMVLYNMMWQKMTWISRVLTVLGRVRFLAQPRPDCLSTHWTTLPAVDVIQLPAEWQPSSMKFS